MSPSDSIFNFGILPFHVLSFLLYMYISFDLKVYGISRRKPDFIPVEVHHISVDLLNAEECRDKFQSLSDITHVFCCAWSNQGKEEDNCKAMKTMVSLFACID